MKNRLFLGLSALWLAIVGVVAAAGAIDVHQQAAKRPFVTYLLITLDPYTVSAGAPVKVNLMITTRKGGPAQNVAFQLTVTGPPSVPSPASYPAFTRKMEAGAELGESGTATLSTAGLQPAEYVVVLTAKDEQGNVVRAENSFTVGGAGGGSGGVAPPVAKPVTSFAGPAGKPMVFAGSAFIYSMAVNVVADANGDLIITSGMVKAGSTTATIVGGMGAMGIGGTPGGSHFEVPKCSWMGNAASLAGDFVDPAPPYAVKVPKAGVKEIHLKITGYYEKDHKPIENPITGEQFVVFKLLLVETK